MGGGGVRDAGDPEQRADIERLAARVAMLASEDGEAANAGRAVGAMARRLGFSGGELKRIFLDGIAVGAGRMRAADGGAPAAAHEDLRQQRAVAEQAAWERDRLVAEVGLLRQRVERLRAALRIVLLAGGAGVLGLAVVGLGVWVGPGRAPVAPTAPDSSGALRRMVLVRPGGARLFRKPEQTSGLIALLPAGKRVWVRRLLWKDLFQWAEVELPGGQVGYVLTTEVDLS
jgi:hypothetical protein